MELRTGIVSKLVTVNENPAVAAETALKTLEEMKDDATITQAQIVAYVAQHELYKQHPDPKAASDLNGFLKVCGFSGTSRSYMYALGGIILPFCEKYGIEIGHLLTTEMFGKTREAISALRKAITKKGCPEAVQEIVRIVEHASNREVVRERCRSKQKFLGTGTVQVSDDEIVLTARPAKGVTAEDLIQKLCLYLDLTVEEGKK